VGSRCYLYLQYSRGRDFVMPKPFALRCFKTVLLLPLLMSYPKAAST
jgi:hypothetical protein